MPDVEYTRNFSICKSFATDGACTRHACQFSHTLFDTGRVSALVGEVSASSQTSLGAGEEKVYFLVEYTKYSTISDDMDPDETKWRMKLVSGGRATLRTGGLGTDTSVGSVSVQPAYPTKGQAKDAVVAMAILERKVFGRTHPPHPERRTLCRQSIAQCCRRGSACSYSHTLFDSQRVEQLLVEAVQERGYKDYRPLIEVEYLRQAGRSDPLWRVTLRCIVGGYQQKASPQPVVATGTDLNSAFSLLERQFAASSGKPQEPQGTPQAGFSNHRRHSSATPRPSGGHRRRRSAPNNNTSRSSDAHTSFPDSPSTHDAPPSYQDAMGSTFTPPASHDSKRRL